MLWSCIKPTSLKAEGCGDRKFNAEDVANVCCESRRKTRCNDEQKDVVLCLGSSVRTAMKGFAAI